MIDIMPAQVAAEAAEEWAQVEVFGHRCHYGRIAEIDRFGAKMLCIDVPTADLNVFETFFYGGGAIFSVTPMTEESARKWAERSRPRPFVAHRRLPPHDPFDELDQAEAEDAGQDLPLPEVPGS